MIRATDQLMLGTTSEEIKSISRLDHHDYHHEISPRSLFRLPYLSTASRPSTRYESSILNTAWMDGLRGLAALAVFNFHYLFAFTDAIQVGYGHDDNHRQIVSLPMFRLLAEGGTAVSIFFVVSGYVCSLKALTLMSGNEEEKGLSGLASSAFRRCLRLYLPVYLLTFVWTILAHFGAFELLRPMFESGRIAVAEVQLAKETTLFRQLEFWFSEISTLSDPWRVTAFYPEHDPHLWAVQFEVRMSLQIYVALLATSAWRPRPRLTLLLLLGFVHFYYGLWEGPLFFFGAAFAQYDLIRFRSRSLPSNQPISEVRQPAYNQPRTRKRSKLLRLGLYILALYFMSYPMSGMQKPSPGYMWINALMSKFPIPTRRDKFPKTVGVLLFMYLLTTDAVELGPPSFWHRMFNSRFAQFMGSIMFGFYLVHGTIFHLFGYGIPHWIWDILGNDNWITYTIGLTTGWAVSLVVTLYAATFFTRGVDTRIVNSIKSVENWCVGV